MYEVVKKINWKIRFFEFRRAEKNVFDLPSIGSSNKLKTTK